MDWSSNAYSQDAQFDGGDGADTVTLTGVPVAHQASIASQFYNFETINFA
jgi:hypothetical protein